MNDDKSSLEMQQKINNVLGENKKLTLSENKKLIDKFCPDKIRNRFHILEINNELMTCTLNYTNIQTNSNKFMILQLLKNDTTDSFAIFSRGGRVGFAGKYTTDLFMDRTLAWKMFTESFYKKTGNTWENKNNDTIASSNNIKYQLVQMKYHDDYVDNDPLLLNINKNKNNNKNKNTTSTNSADSNTPTVVLDDKIIKFISLISNKDLFDQTMKQFMIDSTRLPLGKISISQIGKAYKILDNISEIIDPSKKSNEPKMTKPEIKKELAKYSSQFYSIIPYASGLSAPPSIESSATLSDKLDLLKTLEQILVVADKIANPAVTNHYNTYLKLNVGLETVTDPAIIDRINKYALNTSAQQHKFKFNIKTILKVNRPDEQSNIDKFKGIGNRQLLWHGSRVANIMGILSTGLKINPMNVIRTGSMFGNGLYFSNTASKSAQYIHAKQNGIILLCEVALGTCYELGQSQYITTLPTGYHSTHGLGRNIPDKSQYYVDKDDDDLIYPMGSLKPVQIQSSLFFDEFIVYDARQIKIKYVLVVDL